MLSVCLSWLCHLPLFRKGQAIDSRLSEIGQQQAEAAGQYLKDVKFSNVFVSDMLRAKQVVCFTWQWKRVNPAALTAILQLYSGYYMVHIIWN